MLPLGPLPPWTHGQLKGDRGNQIPPPLSGSVFEERFTEIDRECAHGHCDALGGGRVRPSSARHRADSVEKNNAKEANNVKAETSALQTVEIGTVCVDSKSLCPQIILPLCRTPIFLVFPIQYSLLTGLLAVPARNVAVSYWDALR
jgi:hypothetical protein